MSLQLELLIGKLERNGIAKEKILAIPGFWALWLVLADKKRTREMLLYGSLAAVGAVVLDTIGTEMVLWGYPHTMLFFFPWLNPVDIVGLPVTYMLLYQYFPAWGKYLPALLLMAAVFAFMAEPLLTYMDIYRLYFWRYIYSFPIYIGLGVTLKWVSDRLWQNKNRIRPRCNP